MFNLLPLIGIEINNFYSFWYHTKHAPFLAGDGQLGLVLGVVCIVSIEFEILPRWVVDFFFLQHRWHSRALHLTYSNWWQPVRNVNFPIWRCANPVICDWIYNDAYRVNVDEMIIQIKSTYLATATGSSANPAKIAWVWMVFFVCFFANHRPAFQNVWSW